MHEPADPKAIDQLREAYQRVRAELAKVIVGQEEVLDQLIIALFAGGHCLLEGVPGLAKTLTISTLARSLSLTFNRIQFTPDLMPSDITGTEVIQDDRATGRREFKFLHGPIFANVILADEINRTPPKTQAALLEAMQERHVTAGGERHDLPLPFFLLATQNPIEQEGTYPLPEAQQDRFLFKVYIAYPSYQEEYEVAERTTGQVQGAVNEVLSGPDILRFQRLVRQIPAAPDVLRYALDLTRATRPNESSAPALVKRFITWGAGPRAVQALILGGKARAALKGRYHMAIDDIRALARPVMRHRIVTNFSAEAEGYTTDRVIDDLLAEVVPNKTHLDGDERIRKVLSA
ncbi:MAG: AAA family ATPase [Planctomycetes bacterium]|nr:AAA family ATPase [Planctomycetota bacterium]MBI3833078.1 AAA family ATPase [Planctomycetota bacterium]